MNGEDDMGESLLVESFRDPLSNAASNAYDASDSSNENDFQPTNMTLLDGKFFQHVPERSVGNTQVGICVLCLPKVTEIKGHNKSTSNFVSHLKRRHGPESITAYHKHLQDVKNKRLLQNFQGPRGKRNWRSMTRQQAQTVNSKKWKDGEERTTFRHSGMNETDNGCNAFPPQNTNGFETQTGPESFAPDEGRMPIYPKVEHDDHEVPQREEKSSQTSARWQDPEIQQTQKQENRLAKFFNLMEHTVEQLSPMNQLKAKSQIFDVVSQLELSELSNRADTLGLPQPRQPQIPQPAQRSSRPHPTAHQNASSFAIIPYAYQNNQNSPESTLNGSPEGFHQPQKLG